VIDFLKIIQLRRLYSVLVVFWRKEEKYKKIEKIKNICSWPKKMIMSKYHVTALQRNLSY